MDIKIITKLEDLEIVPKELMDRITTEGYATGSFIMGGYKERTSDIDIIILDNTDLFDCIKPYSIPSPHYHMEDVVFSSIYVKSKSIIFNLLFVKDQNNIDAWLTAQKLCVRLNVESTEFRILMDGKDFRVKQFEMLKNYFGWGKKERESLNEFTRFKTQFN